ncbi:rCG34891, isoform CRA_d [Rattus norvegicus]|nr:rCG34891, isoform CRA_d [Rattus norvegicus]
MVKKFHSQVIRKELGWMPMLLTVASSFPPGRRLT